MRRLLLIGIGAGDPDYVTGRALNAFDVLFVETDELVHLRRSVVDLAGVYRTVELARPAAPVARGRRLPGRGRPLARSAHAAAGGHAGRAHAGRADRRPFAERISASAARAAAAAGVPLLRPERPGWTAGPEDRWHWVDDLPAADAALRELRVGRVLLTTGRQGLAALAANDAAWFLVRCVDPPAPEDLPPRHQVLLDCGPYTLDGELQLIDAHAIDVIVTKDSGGPLTEAKLHAARASGLPVVVVRRPARRDTPTVATVEASDAWVRGRHDADVTGR